VRFPKWKIEGDLIRNSQGEVVVELITGLSAIRRQELVERICEAPHKAYNRGRQDSEEEVRAIRDPNLDEWGGP
jgi:hypothetical protein